MVDHRYASSTIGLGVVTNRVAMITLRRSALTTKSEGMTGCWLDTGLGTLCGSIRSFYARVVAMRAVPSELRHGSSALRVASRRGLGRMRHMEIRRLWLQDEVAAGRLVILYTKGEDNVADLLTKNLGGPRHRMLTDAIGMRAAENNVHEK